MNSARVASVWTSLLLLLVAGSGAAVERQPSPPENLALKARIRANSEYSADYRAGFVADGHIPQAGSREDLRRAWCVQGRTHRQGAELVFQWDTPVTVAELVYYGRSAWFMEECWKGYELSVGDETPPVLHGELQMTERPQRLRLPAPVTTARLVLKFTSSYGGPNPGASEIQVFARSPTEQELRRLSGAPAGVDEVEPGRLRELIGVLRQRYGTRYAQSAEHLRRLDQLEGELRAGRDCAEELARLQREVLLFDVERFVALQRVEINATHVYTYHNEDFHAGGGLYMVSARDPEAPPIELVASPHGQILDCDLSYDGTQVLFSWRQGPDEGYHLWRINLDGSGLRQLTSGEWHDYNGCWLPDGGIAFVSTRRPQFAYCWNSPVGTVHRMDADGTNVRCLSANYLNDFTPYPLEDGRLIYSRWEYVDKPAIPIQSLWTINPDGTGLAGYFGNRVISPGTFMEARSIPGTSKIICTMTGHNGPARGAIGVIDRARGMNAQDAIENLTPDVPVPKVHEGCGNFEGAKPYSSPVPLDSVRFLCSARGPVLVRDFAGHCRSPALRAPGRGLQWFGAQPVRARPKPETIPTLQPKEEAPVEPVAHLLLQDVYRGLEPHVRRGEVKRLRVVHEMAKSVRIHPDKRAFGFQFPVISAGATYAAKDVLGEVDVEADGSAWFTVPAGVPIYFMALDAQGRAVQRMRTFTHLMPGETQSCVGCHANRGPFSPPPGPLLALQKPPQRLQPPEWGAGGFDYAAIVQPVLDRHCVKCHSGVEPEGKVDLSSDRTDYFNVSYETLARGRRQSGEAQYDSPYVSWIPTYNGFEQNILQVAPKAWGSPRSKLADIVLSGHPGETGRPRFDLSQAEQRRILAWIDLNVPYYGTSETSHPESQGSRRVYPKELDRVLAEVAVRRCAGCHKDGKVPRPFWTRITNPQLNSFLTAPLARVAGGRQACGQAVFADTLDADYWAILRTFDPVLAELAAHPRTDMPGSKPSLAVNRCCK